LEILEQLENKVLTAVCALQDVRAENKALAEQNQTLTEKNQTLEEKNAAAEKELAELKAKLAETEQELLDAKERLQHRDTAITAVQHQYESVKKDNARLANEKNDWEEKVSALMETLTEAESA